MSKDDLIAQPEAKDAAGAKGKASPGPWRWAGDLYIEELRDAEDCLVGVMTTGLSPNDRLSTADAALIAAAPEMAELLRELEHLGDYSARNHCPVCDAHVDSGHFRDCRLDALLTRVGR